MTETMDLTGRILIADCDKRTLLNTMQLLQRKRYECTPAQNKGEVFRALKANKYDSLIAETRMPNSEELEFGLCARTRQESP